MWGQPLALTAAAVKYVDNLWGHASVETSPEQTRTFCLYLVRSEGLFSSAILKARNIITSWTWQ